MSRDRKPDVGVGVLIKGRLSPVDDVQRGWGFGRRVLRKEQRFSIRRFPNHLETQHDIQGPSRSGALASFRVIDAPCLA